MREQAKAKDTVSAEAIRGGSAVERALINSRWAWEHWRRGELIDSWVEKNLCTNEGLNYLLGAGFTGVTAISDWYIAVYDNNHTPASNNTYATPGFTEATNYDEATRPEWDNAGVSAKALTNTAAKASFTFTSAATIYGAALVGGGTAATTKGDAAGAGKLYNVSAFSSGAKGMASSDILKVTITITAADA
jgi:hypothetical protein